MLPCCQLNTQNRTRPHAMKCRYLSDGAVRALNYCDGVPGLGALLCSSISCSSVRNIRSQARETSLWVQAKPILLGWGDQCLSPAKVPTCCTCRSTAALCEGDSPACSFQYSTCTQSVELSCSALCSLHAPAKATTACHSPRLHVGWTTHLLP